MEQNGYVYTEAKQMITTYLRLKEDELQPDSHIVDDIGADSLALVELGFQISEKFGVPIVDTSDDKLIFKNLVAYIEQHMQEQAKS
ncbi:acyl carrier protein [candidate division KSB1 bacterium]|nr:acyl carrier protein [candidate division KSB1 bacterium]RQW00285.1 MAG: acyl carrier protein [candidate division KSB1 bacterium]